jgi:hypothetical protein
MVSGVVPLLYTTIQTVIEILPTVPAPSLGSELPLSVLDGFSRTFLLCNFVPPTVTAHALPNVANSPWTLVLTSLVRDIVQFQNLFDM